MSVEQRRITLDENADGWWTAREREIGVTTQGETREEALANLDEAIEGALAALDSDSPAPEPTVPWFGTDTDE